MLYFFFMSVENEQESFQFDPHRAKILLEELKELAIVWRNPA